MSITQVVASSTSRPEAMVAAPVLDVILHKLSNGMADGTMGVADA